MRMSTDSVGEVGGGADGGGGGDGDGAAKGVVMKGSGDGWLVVKEWYSSSSVVLIFINYQFLLLPSHGDAPPRTPAHPHHQYHPY